MKLGIYRTACTGISSYIHVQVKLNSSRICQMSFVQMFETSSADTQQSNSSYHVVIPIPATIQQSDSGHHVAIWFQPPYGNPIPATMLQFNSSLVLQHDVDLTYAWKLNCLQMCNFGICPTLLYKLPTVLNTVQLDLFVCLYYVKLHSCEPLTVPYYVIPVC